MRFSKEKEREKKKEKTKNLQYLVNPRNEDVSLDNQAYRERTW